MTTLAKFEQDFTENVIGYSAIGIIVSTCLGSFAIMQILSYGHSFPQMLMVMVVVMLCGTHNAAILTVQKPHIILKLLIASSLVSAGIILTSLFV